MQRINQRTKSDKILIALVLMDMECIKLSKTARNLDTHNTYIGIAWVDDRPMNQLAS